MDKSRGVGHSRYKHGMCRTRFYTIWRGMNRRCKNPNRRNYHTYGGRGIQLCESWEDFKVFMNDMYKSYLEHVQEHGEKNTTIDRVDNNKGYSKENCRWATSTRQSRNRSNNHLITVGEDTKTIAGWAEKTGLNRGTIWSRIMTYGWSPAKAVSQPVKR